ncbi:unnamed protein product [Adineta steineri]|uniref:NAD(P)(+)--arginine ADP-ribosyltransferase n=1 Tax=Adineta steineri TaxID=433720 RepID=A0A818IRK2_9BILA|nr:unnamed protein product [Adineta steineri]CAF3527321.1 unnamed protein product [Adineta steineri]
MEVTHPMEKFKSCEIAVISNGSEQRRRMLQDYLLIWLDEYMDETNQDYKNTLKQIQTITDNVNVFNYRDECIDFLSDAEDINFFLIVKDTMAQQIMPLITDIPQLDSVYILSDIEILDEEWTKKWNKIKSIHTNINSLCQPLQLGIKHCNQDLIAVSFIMVNEMGSTDKLNQLEPTFMYTQIFKDILLDMEYSTQAITDFATYCRQNNSGSLINIDRFEKEYHTQSPAWWYTSPSFIHSMLNYALRSMEGDTIINMGFFIRDLHQQIQQLHQQQLSSYHDIPFIVYRGQGLSNINFEKIQKTKGGLMSFNNFLSTSKERQISLEYSHAASQITDMVGILFIMFIDPNVKSVPFASVKDLSYFQEEDELLFSMHAVFRVGTIQQIDINNQLYQVELQLTSDNDQQLRILTDRIREEADNGTGWNGLGNLLLTIGQFKKAEELYNVLLEQTSDEDEKTLCYNQLGLVHSNQGDHRKAIWYYEQRLELQQKTVPSNHPSLATSYNNIGSVYNNMGEYSKALLFYEKDLEICQTTLPSNHPSLATTYGNIGSVYNDMGEYQKALSYYEKVLEIGGKTLPLNHPSFVASYNNIGLVYNNMGEYSKALSFYEKSREIYEITLPSNHSSLAILYNNIGIVYNNMGEYSKALSFYEEALEIREETCPSNNPLLATSYSNMGLVYNNMGEYLKALSFHEKSLEILENTLPSNHPSLAALYGNIGLVYDNMGEYSKAFSFYKKSLEIKQRTLPSNHHSLATSYNNTGSVYRNMGEYSTALSF